MLRMTVVLALLCASVNAQELCTSTPCTANSAEFNAVTASDNSSQAFKLASTLPATSSTVFGAYFALTGAGSSFGDQRAVLARMFPGKTGSGFTTALQALDQSQGTGVLAIGAVGGSVGTFSAAIGATTGSKGGIYAFGADSSTFNFGGVFIGDGGALNLGTAGVAGGAGSPSARVGVYGGYGSFPSNGMEHAAVLADNANATTLPLFVARQNGLSVVKIPAGGGIQLVDRGTRPTCDEARRGLTWYDAGASGVADSLSACVKDASDTYAWEPLD